MKFVGNVLGYSKPQDVPAEPTKGEPASAVQLVSYPKEPKCQVTATAFGGKIEVALRLAGIPYTGLCGDVTKPQHAPKHKFPVLRHGSNIVSDSSEIFQYLLNTYPEKMKLLVPDEPDRRIMALALQRMLEEDLYFCICYCNWQRDDYYYKIFAPRLFSFFPGPLYPAMIRLVRASVLRDLHGQGIGRHSFEFVKRRMAEELDACDALLAKSRAFLTGSTPCQADCFLFASLELALAAESKDGVEDTTGNMVRERPHLLSFHERLSKQLFSSDITDQWKANV